MDRRVVISGIGLITPLAIGVKETWTALCEGKSGITGITRFDPSDFETKIAGEVKDFNPEDFLPKKEARRTETFIAYAIAAARMAMEDSGFEINTSNADRVAVITGCGLGGLGCIEETTKLLEKRGPKRVSPFYIPMLLGNMAPGMVSIHLGAKGPNFSLTTACASGTHAIGEAFRIVKRGDADAAITGGVESVITPTCFAGFNALKALSTRNDDPQKASRPFERDRDGFVVAEGCGLLFIETLESALKRGAHIYAEICGYGLNSDGYHMTAPSPEGEGAARCMKMALDDAGIAYDQVDYINAHGTSTPLNDVYETMAIKSVFREKAHSIAISSTKSMTGHLLGAAGGVEAAFTALTIHDDIIPPTINLDNPEKECDLDYVPHTARKTKVEIAMTNSFGFGGTNATLMLKKYHD
ncbi:MAG: beta-ketoacyl-ACP synthase II [Deltaproteobacteria bacterium]|nr:beta-ketoacyl-ACP synthase II [Deltaproteobacteria bacterium]